MRQKYDLPIRRYGHRDDCRICDDGKAMTCASSSSAMFSRSPRHGFRASRRRAGAGTTGKLAEELGVDTNVRFLGRVEDVPEFLAALDVSVLSSVHEAFPLSLLESMAASIPMVATDVGSVSEIVEDGVNGFLVPSGDHEKFAAAIFAWCRTRSWPVDWVPMAARSWRTSSHLEDGRSMRKPFHGMVEGSRCRSRGGQTSALRTASLPRDPLPPVTVDRSLRDHYSTRLCRALPHLEEAWLPSIRPS